MLATTEVGVDVLRQHLRSQGQLMQSCNAAILDQTTDERRVVEYQTEHRCSDGTTVGKSHWISKFYANQQGNNTFQVMVAVRQALLEATGSCRLAVPEALHYDRANRVLLQEKVTGRPYVDLVNSSDFDHHLREAGQALAELHSLEMKLEPHVAPLTEMSHHIEQLIRPEPAQLHDHFPKYAERLEACLRWIVAQEDSWRRQFVPGPIHRDIHLRQLFAAESKVWLVDWDCFAWGDPAFDVAYFTAYLQSHLSVSRQPRAVAAFLDGYFKIGRDELLARIPVYENFNLIRRACRRLRLRDFDWRAQAERMLQRMNFD